MILSHHKKIVSHLFIIILLYYLIYDQINKWAEVAWQLVFNLLDQMNFQQINDSKFHFGSRSIILSAGIIRIGIHLERFLLTRTFNSIILCESNSY